VNIHELIKSINCRKNSKKNKVQVAHFLYKAKYDYVNAFARRQHNDAVDLSIADVSQYCTEKMMKISIIQYNNYLILWGSVAEWIGRRACDQHVAGSDPDRRAAKCNPGQVVYTHDW